MPSVPDIKKAIKIPGPIHKIRLKLKEAITLKFLNRKSAADPSKNDGEKIKND